MTKKSTTYSIKNLKTGPSKEDGPNGSYTCTLYRDNKRVATVFEAGNGGDKLIRWIDSKEPRQKVEGHFYGEMKTVKATPEEAWLIRHVADKTYFCAEIEKEFHHSMDTYICQLVIDFEENREFKRKCKKHTLIILHSHQPNAYKVFTLPYSPQIKRHIEDKYGDDLKEIVNERYV